MPFQCLKQLAGPCIPEAFRRYDVSTGTFDVFVPPNASGGSLGQPWYLTFRDTDPATLDFVAASPSAAGGAAAAPMTRQATSAINLPPLASILRGVEPQAVLAA